jgi:hypothetical protein
MENASKSPEMETASLGRPCIRDEGAATIFDRMFIAETRRVF